MQNFTPPAATAGSSIALSANAVRVFKHLGLVPQVGIDLQFRLATEIDFRREIFC
jgi:hypothetical protein